MRSVGGGRFKEWWEREEMLKSTYNRERRENGRGPLENDFDPFILFYFFHKIFIKLLLKIPFMNGY